MDATALPASSTTLDVLVIAAAPVCEAVAAATRTLDVVVRRDDRSAAAGTPHVILIALDDSAALALVERHARATPQATIVVLVPSATPDTIVRTMRAGAAEVLALPLDPDALACVLTKIATIRGMRLPATDAAGRVVTMLAPKDGVGATTLVANLGVRLAGSQPLPVALVDLDLRNGDLALLLNVDPPQALADLALGVELLDAVFVHGSLVRHASGLSLLAASTERSREFSGLTADHVEGVLGLLCSSHGLVMVDAPPPLSDAAIAAALCADRVLIPTEPTVPCLRAAWRTLEALERLDVPGEAIDVVVTRYEAGEAHLALDEMADALGRPLRYVIPRDDDTACLALNGGLPIASVRPEGTLQQAIETLATAMVATNPQYGARSTSAPFGTL